MKRTLSFFLFYGSAVALVIQDMLGQSAEVSLLVVAMVLGTLCWRNTFPEDETEYDRGPDLYHPMVLVGTLLPYLIVGGKATFQTFSGQIGASSLLGPAVILLGIAFCWVQIRAVARLYTR